jgi:hypothetical protein
MLPLRAYQRFLHAAPCSGDAAVLAWPAAHAGSHGMSAHASHTGSLMLRHRRPPPHMLARFACLLEQGWRRALPDELP